MSAQNRNVNFLIVDDDQVDVRAVKRGLLQHKLANPVFVASDGQEALDLLRGANGRKRLPRPYLILLDLNMPRMNGIRFLEEVRCDPELHDSIVFVLTTSSSDQDLVAAYNQHIAGYIVKSDAGAEFLRLVQMLERFVLVVQFPPEHP